jgi:hypothetical protein
MKTIKNLFLPVILIVLLPLLAHAHPGHDHSGNFWQVFQHFVFTYYIYFIVAFAVIAGLARYLYVSASKHKHSPMQNGKDKK